MPLGRLIGLGYGSLRGSEELAKLIEGQRIDLLIDVRYSPRSRYRPAWNGPTATKQTVEAAGIPAYLHVQGLGNPNFADPGHMRLADPETVRLVNIPLEHGLNVALMCACKRVNTCHRQLVIDLVRTFHPDIEVVNLGEGRARDQGGEALAIPWDVPDGDSH